MEGELYHAAFVQWLFASAIGDLKLPSTVSGKKLERLPNFDVDMREKMSQEYINLINNIIEDPDVWLAQEVRNFVFYSSLSFKIIIQNNEQNN